MLDRCQPRILNCNFGLVGQQQLGDSMSDLNWKYGFSPLSEELYLSFSGIQMIHFKKIWHVENQPLRGIDAIFTDGAIVPSCGRWTVWKSVKTGSKRTTDIKGASETEQTAIISTRRSLKKVTLGIYLFKYLSSKMVWRFNQWVSDGPNKITNKQHQGNTIVLCGPKVRFSETVVRFFRELLLNLRHSPSSNSYKHQSGLRVYSHMRRAPKHHFQVAAQLQYHVKQCISVRNYRRRP